MDKIAEEITEKDKMAAIGGLRTDMLKQYSWQKKMIHEIKVVSISTIITMAICFMISLYFVFRPEKASDIDLKYINTESGILNSRRKGLDAKQVTLNEERESFEKQKAIFVVAQALSDSNLRIREKNILKPITVKANNVNTKNINVVNTKTVIKK